MKVDLVRIEMAPHVGLIAKLARPDGHTHRQNSRLAKMSLVARAYAYVTARSQ